MKSQKSIQLTADHVIFVSKEDEIKDGISSAFSLTSENVIPEEHYLWILVRIEILIKCFSIYYFFVGRRYFVSKKSNPN